MAVETVKRRKGPLSTPTGGLFRNIYPGDQITIVHGSEELLLTYQGNRGGLQDAWSFKGPMSFQIKTAKKE